MTRTQILLETWQHKFLSGLARKKGKSLSALIREWIDEKAAAFKASGSRDSLYDMVGSIEDKAADVSENVDAYLYGGKRPER
ncbi:MAG: hypothetical protein HY922_12245 [Elusimicrobia bacterium]|nr:hypothetical protein [Elusimicrobiota bacterium]